MTETAPADRAAHYREMARQNRRLAIQAGPNDAGDAFTRLAEHWDRLAEDAAGRGEERG